MVYEIAAGVAVLIFAILAYFIIVTLVRLQRVLTRVDRALWDVEMKAKNLDPLFRSIGNVGDICEEKTLRLKKRRLERYEEKNDPSDTTADLAEWLAIGMQLGAKILKRR